MPTKTSQLETRLKPKKPAPTTYEVAPAPTGYVEADGPYCPRDNEALVFVKNYSYRETSVEAYQEVNPPRDFLSCPKCKKPYYLEATEREPRRIGDTQELAAWRLGGGETAQERLARRMGLR